MRAVLLISALASLALLQTAAANNQSRQRQQQHLDQPFADLLRRATTATTSSRLHLERRAPQESQPGGDGCRKCDAAILECPPCQDAEVCTLVKRTCQECARNVCTSISVIASASHGSKSSGGSTAQTTPWVITGVCAGAVFAVALGMFAVWKRRQSKKIILGETNAGKDEEDEEDEGFGGKSSMELEHGDQFLFPPPAVAWRSSQSSSESWEDETSNKNRNVMGLRVETDITRKQSLERANAATNTLATMAMVATPPRAAVRGASPLLPDPKAPAGDRVLLPELNHLSRFSITSSSFDAYGYGANASQDNASTNGQKSPSFPCPGMPPPRPPTSTAASSWRDSSVDMPGMTSNRSSSVSAQSVHSIAQINVASVKPMTARQTMIRRSLLGEKVAQPMVGSLSEVQGWQRASSVRDDYASTSYPRLSLGRHSSTASLGNMPDIQRMIQGDAPMAAAKLKRNSSLNGYRNSQYRGL